MQTKNKVRHLTILQICTRNKEVKVIFIRIYRSSHLGYSGKKIALKYSFSESCQGKFAVKILEKYLRISPRLVKLYGRSL